MHRSLLPILALLLATAPLHAQQGIRPGSSSRGGTTGTNNTRRTGTTGGGGGGNSGGGNNSSSQHQYRNNSELGDATIQIDPETRSLVIVTDEETHRELDKVIKNLDRPKPQVLIKVVFLEVTYNKDSDIGIEGSYTYNMGTADPATTNNTSKTTSTTGTNKNGTTFTDTTTATTAATTAAAAAKALGVNNAFGLASQTSGTFVKLVANDWAATLRLASTKGRVQVLSRPSIMARNNQEAVIVVGQEVPFITNSQVTTQGNTINTIQYDNIGIILRVTPFITSENSVEMIVAPEISSLTDQSIPISSTASSPVISKRSAETVVVTPNAKTVVIGGLMETQHISSVQKIPWLGDIPYLGVPFRRTIKSNVKKELLIFLTPYIIQTPEALESLSTHEVGQTEVANKSFSKTEFDKFLDSSDLYPTLTGQTPPTPAPKKTSAKVTGPAKATPAPAAAESTPAPAPPKPKPAGASQPSNPKARGG